MKRDKLWEQINEKLEERGIKVTDSSKPPYNGEMRGQVHKFIKCYDEKVISYLGKDEENKPYRGFKKVRYPIYGYWYWTGDEWVRKPLPNSNMKLKATSVDDFVAKGGRVEKYNQRGSKI